MRELKSTLGTLTVENLLNFKAIEKSHRTKGFVKSFVELMADDGVKDTITV